MELGRRVWISLSDAIHRFVYLLMGSESKVEFLLSLKLNLNRSNNLGTDMALTVASHKLLALSQVLLLSPGAEMRSGYVLVTVLITVTKCLTRGKFR